MAKSAAVLVILVAAIGALAQTPQIQNGRVETRAVTSLARDVAALAAQTGAAAQWVAWQVPMVDGDRGLCCTHYTDGMVNPVRGCTMEPSTSDQPWKAPDFPAPSGPVQLEAGTRLTVFVRLVDKRIERLRVVSDDCPVDAGGRDVTWLTSVNGADSVAFLKQLALDETMEVDVRSRISQAAVRGLALHRDPSAVGVLIELASAGAPSPHLMATRREAMQSLGMSRDPRALEFLAGIISR